MAKKKGKKKKSKKSKSAAAASDGEQPELDLVGDGAQLGISKEKKKKKSKLTKEEKEEAKIEKKLQDFLSDEKKYETFWNKMHYWTKNHYKEMEKLYRKFDIEEDGEVPFGVFKAGLRDLSCPVVEMEIYALARILDQEKSGLISYIGFKDGLLQSVETDDSGSEDGTVSMKQDDYVPKVYVTNVSLTSKVLCDPSQVKFPRFVSMEIKLKEFAKYQHHPGNFTAMIQTHLTVAGVLQVIRDLTLISSGQLSLYTHEDCSPEHCLPPYLLLTDCGFSGGPENNPQKGILYYNYTVEFDDCPLLNCDYYFGHSVKPLNPVLKGYQKG